MFHIVNLSYNIYQAWTLVQQRWNVVC